MAKTAHTIRISSFLEVLRLEGHGRIARIDELRGALILLVLIYHLLYDITLFFPAAATVCGCWGMPYGRCVRWCRGCLFCCAGCAPT